MKKLTDGRRTSSDGNTFGSCELKNDEKRAITPRRVIKIAGHVDLDKLNMFSVYTQHLSLIVFEIKDEKY
jgi:hypothetical protein